MQFAGQRPAAKKQRKYKPPVSDVWESMGMDQYLSSRVVGMRKATNKMMSSIYQDLLPFIESTEFPNWLVDKIKPLGVNGL